VRKLVRHFEDPEVGVVCGALNFIRSRESQNTESVYWQYESMLRLMEARLGSTLTASGAIYAIRRTCYQPLEAGAVLDDLLIPMRARGAGYKVVYDPEATATDFAAATVAGEALRRTRLAVGSFRALPELMKTRMPYLAFWSFISHKLLRWTAPFFVIGLLVSNVLLIGNPWYQAFLAMQLFFYAWAWCGLLFRTYLQRVPYALVGYFLFAMNFAMLRGFFKAFRPRKEGTWERVS
jgi:cellulose synthase/poly-beta-1,6-N-acetylglucosamine synthase-like glycosyltransferase